MTNRIKMNDISALMAAMEPNTEAKTADRAMYPFWGAPANSTTLVRILPVVGADGQPDPGALPWVEKRTIKLTFDGVINSDRDTTAEVTVTVPCNETFGGKCPITEDIRPLWKGSEDERNLARRFYRKPVFLMHGFVVSSPMVETNLPESPIRRFHINRSLFEVVKTSCMDAALEYAPWDLEAGRDFKINKTQQGQWPSYATSAFSFKETALTAPQLTAIQTFGIPRLDTLLGEKPDAAMLRMIFDLYKDSLEGRPFDNAKYGQHFRAYEAGKFGAATTGRPQPQAKTTEVPWQGATARDQQSREILENIKTRVAAR